MVADKRKQAVRLQASVLRAALADVLGAVEARSTLPILSNVLIDAGDGQIRLTSTNLDIMVTRDCATADRDGPASADWTGSIRPFATTVPAKPLAAILGEFDSAAMVRLELVDDKVLVVSAGRARFKLNALPTGDFPLLAEQAEGCLFEVSASVLADAFARVEFAISTEETRYYLNGIFVHVVQEEGEPQWLVLATTDGHRLARLRMEVPAGAAAWPQAIWPRGAVQLLDKLLRTAAKTGAENQPSPAVVVEANEAGTMLRFTMPAADGGEIGLTTKAIDGTFPDYSRVIPQNTTATVLVDRAALAAAIKRVGVLADAKTRAVKAAITGDLIELVVTTADVGEAREEVACTYQGEDITIGFNGQFARECLVALACDQVSLAFTDAGSPVLVRATGADTQPDALVQVLMPMRV